MAFTGQLGTSDSRLGNIVLGYGSSTGPVINYATGSFEGLVGGVCQPELYARTTQITALVIQGDADPHARTTQITALVIYRPGSVSGTCRGYLYGSCELPPVDAEGTCYVQGVFTGVPSTPAGSFGRGAFRLNATGDATIIAIDHLATGDCQGSVFGEGDVVTVSGSFEGTVGGYAVYRKGHIATPCLTGDGDTSADQDGVF